MAAVTSNTFSTDSVGNMNGFFKRVFAPKLENRCPISMKLQTDIGFDNSATPGEEYQQTVGLQEEQGVTYAASTEDDFVLNDPESGKYSPARIAGSMHVLRTRIGYKAAWAGAGGEKSFENTTKNRIKSMWKTTHKRVEVDLIFGGSETGLGTDTGNSTTAFVFDVTTWAPQLWAGATGMWVEIWDVAGVNPGDAPTTSLGVTQITAINHTTRTLTLSPAVTAGTAPRFITISKSTASTGKGQISGGNWVTMMGLRTIGRKVTGTLFGISSTLDTWQPNVISGVGVLGFPAWQDAIAVGVGKGLDGDTTGYIPPTSWADLMTDQAALRRYDSSQNRKVYQVGAKDVEFFSQNGKSTIKVHPYLFPSEAYILQLEDFSRIGTHDVTFKRPNMPGVDRDDNYFLELPNNYSFELRCSSDQALFTSAISTIITLTGIT
jgi:hypothetical protein